jgi:hypothetical protein
MATEKMPFTRVLQISFHITSKGEQPDWGNKVEMMNLEYKEEDINTIDEELIANQLAYPQADRKRNDWEQSFLPVWGMYDT